MKHKLAISILLGLLLCAAIPAAEKHESDDHIYDMVKRRLANDPVVKGGAIQVEVQQGIVTLRGSVELEKQRAKAEKLAKKISGVKQVKNELQVARRGSR